MPLKTAKLKALVKPMASSSGTEDATPQEEIKSLQRQLAKSKLYAATLQATIKEQTKSCNTLAFTDLDYKCIAAAIEQLQSRDQSTDYRAYSTTAPLELARCSLKQLNPPLLFNSKDPTYTS